MLDVLTANTQAIVTMESRIGSRMDSLDSRLDRLEQDISAIKRHFGIE